MYQVEDEPVKTIHLYVMREGPIKPSLTGIILSVIALSILIAIGVLTPYQQPVQRASIRVPAVPLGMSSFTASAAIMPTGIKTYPATTAHGLLTITNGSVIGQTIPAEFTVQGVVTDSAVYVPPGNANSYGYATVPADALMSGMSGNLPPLTINQVIGSSVYIRNLTAFYGGRASYSVKYATEQDRVKSLQTARSLLMAEVTGLHYPCKETVFPVVGKMVITWRCQFITYQVPSYMHVLSMRFSGKNLLLSVIFVTRPKRFRAK